MKLKEQLWNRQLPSETPPTNGNEWIGGTLRRPQEDIKGCEAHGLSVGLINADYQTSTSHTVVCRGGKYAFECLWLSTSHVCSLVLSWNSDRLIVRKSSSYRFRDGSVDSSLPVSSFFDTRYTMSDHMVQCSKSKAGEARKAKKHQLLGKSNLTFDEIGFDKNHLRKMTNRPFYELELESVYTYFFGRCK